MAKNYIIINNIALCENDYLKAVKAGQSYNWAFIEEKDNKYYYQCQSTMIKSFKYNKNDDIYWINKNNNKNINCINLYNSYNENQIITETKESFIIKDILS
jgi:hypothetical protein